MTTQPLAGLRVIDLGQEIAAPFCAKLMAALGAEVIKIEPVAGDKARRMGPFPDDLPHPERSGLFLYLNTGKQGVTLNFECPTGRELFLRLTARADVVLENFPPSYLGAIDLGYDTLRQTNPRLILTSITPFGHSGPYRDDRASDIGIHAISGEMSLQGEPYQPLKKGANTASYLGGLNGFLGTFAALFKREQTGTGEHVDVSLAEGLTAMIGGPIREQSNLGRPPQRKTGSGLPGPGGIHPVQDGFIVAMGRMGVDCWPDIADMVGRKDLCPDASSAPEQQAAQQAALGECFSAWLRSRTKHDVYHEAHKRRLPFGYVATAPDLLCSPQLAHREFLQQVSHPEVANLTLMGLPFLFDGPRRSVGRAPLLGEHNEAVFCDILGLSRQDLVVLRHHGII
jgi:CoA:oxalate CoA-transferase